MVESRTEPPCLLTEADLIALTEKQGIGTDATRAEHIEKIKSGNYGCVQADGKFTPGKLQSVTKLADRLTRNYP